jgi:hypothetical protein
VAEIKKVSIRMSELREITGSLSKVLSQDLPIKQAYRMSKMAKAINSELKEFNEMREKLIRKYGERDEQGNISVKEKANEFNEEFQPLLEEEIELSLIPIDLNEIQNVKLSPIDIANLEPFLDEKSEMLLNDEVEQEVKT